MHLAHISWHMAMFSITALNIYITLNPSWQENPVLHWWCNHPSFLIARSAQLIVRSTLGARSWSWKIIHVKLVGFVNTSWANWSPSKYLWAINNRALRITGRVNSSCLFTEVLIRWFVVSNQPRCWPTARLGSYQGGYGHYFLRIFEKTTVNLEILFH